jgi:hypothetical protein
MNRHSAINLLTGLLALLIPAGLLAQTNYVASVIDRTNPFGRVLLEDLNGDGLADLVDYRWRRGFGRELLIYHQSADGRFSPNPQFVEIKTEIIAVGFADLRPEPGKELVLFANNGVFSLSTAIEGYAGNLKPLFEWKLIADVPDPDQVQFFNGIGDIDGDGQVDLLIPGTETYGLFRNTGPEQFQLATEFSTLNLELDPGLRPRGDGDLNASIDINSRDGIKLQISAAQPTPFSGFLDEWDARSEDTDNLLRAENWMPPALLADFNGDQRQDIVFINVGQDIRGQVNLMLQRNDGSFPARPDWQGPIDTRGDIRMMELNGDDLMDMVRLNGEGNEWTAFFYINRSTSFQFDQPDQVMRFSGYDVDLQVIDIDGDGRPELNVSYYTIPVVEAIRNTGIVRTQLIYTRDSESLFGRRPQSRLEESFSASNVRGLTEQMSLRRDVDGDGRPDALYITDEGAIAAKRIGEDLRIADQPFWEYVPSRSVIGFNVVDLNQDDLPDLILRHSASYTILVTNP